MTELQPVRIGTDKDGTAVYRDPVTGDEYSTGEVEPLPVQPGPPDATYKICSVCARLVKADPRGDVLDASGRCIACQP